MSRRANPWRGLGVRASPARLTATMTWEQIAAFHSSGRNNVVVQTLVNAAAVRQMRAFASLSFTAELDTDAAAYDEDANDHLTAVGASLQLPGGALPERTIPAVWQARLDALQASDAVRAEFRKKAITMVEAHCLPCAIEINGRRLDQFIEQALIGAPGARRHDAIKAARTPFAEIDPVPLIFNECDSHAEQLGLKHALVSACRTLPYGLSFPSPRHILDRVHNAYECWKAEALTALGRTIERNREMLAEAQKSGDVLQIITREAKIGILEGYRRDTESVAPVDLNAGNIQHLFSQVSEIVRLP